MRYCPATSSFQMLPPAARVTVWSKAGVIVSAFWMRMLNSVPYIPAHCGWPLVAVQISLRSTSLPRTVKFTRDQSVLPPAGTTTSSSCCSV